VSIEIYGLQKRYGDFSLTLDVSVAGGEILVLVGPSGCGKTTALNLIAGFAQPSGGSVLVDNTPVTGLPPWKRNIAVVFQDLALFPHLNVEKNITYGLFIRGVGREERRRIAAGILRVVRLEGYETRPVHTLSGGERQRVAIGRALAISPRALLLDEPFSSLDAPLRRALRQEFLEIHAGSGVPCIFVTHDREEAAVLGDRIALMSAGRILELGSDRELFFSPKTEFGVRFFGSGAVLPCVITGAAPQARKIQCSLGTLLVPRDSEQEDPQGSLLFIPWDALHPAGTGPVWDRTFTALFRRSVFQGVGLTVELELSDGTLFKAEVNARMDLPAPGTVMKWGIDQRLLRLVKPALPRPANSPENGG
jgi:ABC-type Fe3+/spermidine/putrescine transport system ATPase subunit